MLENSGHRSNISNTSNKGIRKSWSEFFRSFFSNTKNVQGGLQKLGESSISRRLDEELSTTVLSPDKIDEINEINDEIMSETKIPKTKEEIFSTSNFEWIKTERAGEVCKFQFFEVENGVEYTNFTDNTRIRTDLIGDIVLMHDSDYEILGSEIVYDDSALHKPLFNDQPNQNTISVVTHENVTPEIQNIYQDPVTSILDKSKKRNEKLVLTLNVKIPSPELFNVIKENFDNTEEILLNNIIDQIKEKDLKDAIRREIQNIYSPKKKKT